MLDGDGLTAVKGNVKGAAPGRRVIYCLIPPELAEKLHEPLRDHFAGDAGVEVIVERRSGGERRSEAERRSGQDRRAEAADPERRTVRATRGRRAGQRRARAVETDPPALPRNLRRHARRLRFLARSEPAGLQGEDLDTARLVARFQAGEREIFATLYTRYFDRIFGYMRVAVKNREEAEDLTQEVFAEMLAALPRYERRETPFRSWMFTIVRNTAIKHLRKQRRIDLVGEDELALQAERGGSGSRGKASAAESAASDDAAIGELGALNWIADPDLLLFVERLPSEQRQAIVMRFVLGMSAPQIASELGQTPEAIRAQQSRALRFLRDRLTAIGRTPARGERPVSSLSPIRPMTVLRERRFGLSQPGRN